MMELVIYFRALPVYYFSCLLLLFWYINFLVAFVLLAVEVWLKPGWSYIQQICKKGRYYIRHSLHNIFTFNNVLLSQSSCMLADQIEHIKYITLIQNSCSCMMASPTCWPQCVFLIFLEGTSSFSYFCGPYELQCYQFICVTNNCVVLVNGTKRHSRQQTLLCVVCFTCLSTVPALHS